MAPEVHVAAAITGEVKILTIRRPDWIPVCRGVFGDDERFTPAAWNGGNITPADAWWHEPEGDARAVWRPRRLHCVGFGEQTPGAGFYVNYPKLARNRVSNVRRVATRFADDDLLVVWRPGRMETSWRHGTQIFTGGFHYINPGRFAIRAKSNTFAVRGKGRLSVVGGRILR